VHQCLSTLAFNYLEDETTFSLTEYGQDERFIVYKIFTADE
jgi:hypothetical protein